MDEERKYRGTYTAEPKNPFLACAIEGCQLEYPHLIGRTEDRKWQHVWAFIRHHPTLAPAD
jgi:hypothetical protein